MSISTSSVSRAWGGSFMTPINGELLTLYAFAVWRLSYMLVNEAGAWDMFDHVRRGAERIGLGGLFSCVYCMSVWVSALMLITHALAPVAAYIVALWLALSAIAVVLTVIVGYLRGDA